MKLLLMFLAPAALLAQHATLSGLVKDSGQSAVPEARLVVLQVETGTERSAKSNSAGQYAVTSLAPGHYKITVEAKGFAAKSVETVELQAGQDGRLDFTLQGADGEIRGKVADARGGEALSDVEVRLAGTAYRTNSDAAGNFRIGAIPPGDYVLNISTVGYHMEKHTFHLDGGASREFSVVLTPDTLRQTETVYAKGDPFDTARGDAPDVLVLAGNDVKNLASVLADDPLRAVQGLPGVTSDKDFEARFSLRGADISRIGLYLDGILLHEPFHTSEGVNLNGSVTAFNGDLVEEMDLYKGAFPVRYEGATAGVLDVTTREGSRDGLLFRASASSSAAGLLVEGPLGRRNGGKAKGSWVVAARKSYVQYILSRTVSDPSFVFDMEDVQARLTYDVTPRNSLTVSVLESYTDLDQSGHKATLSINSVLNAGYHYTLGNLAWRYAPSSKLAIVSHAAWMREKYNDMNPTPQPLAGGYYGEWVGNSTAAWQWSERATLDVGFSARQVRSQSFSNQYQTGAPVPLVLDHANGTALLVGGFTQQSWSTAGGRLRLTAGARWDDQSIDHVSAVSPEASLSLGLTKTTSVQAGWGEAAQYPEISVFLSPFGNRALLPIRSIHTVAAINQKLGARTRLRAEVYQRTDRDLPWQSFYDPRILNGQIFNPPANPLYYDSLRGRSRGAEIFLQRSSGNRYTGWISYAYGHTMMYDGVANQQFPADYDQRHTVNVHNSFRLTPTINLSLRVSYGSGFPIPGYLREVPDKGYYLAASRNQLRLPAYQRTDLRINKAWMKAKWKYTLYGEIINLTDHGNSFLQSFNNYQSPSGQVSLSINKEFPILPSVGMAIEW
jgi:hypothetical protein